LGLQRGRHNAYEEESTLLEDSRGGPRFVPWLVKKEASRILGGVFIICMKGGRFAGKRFLKNAGVPADASQQSLLKLLRKKCSGDKAARVSLKDQQKVAIGGGVLL